MSAEPDYRIRSMNLPELRRIIQWAADEGWNPGIHDAETFHAADPQGFFVGELDGEPICSGSVVLYDDRFAFLGLYMVRPEYRGKGYGIALTRARLARVGNRNAGIDGVVAMQEKYKRIGYRLAYRNIRFSGHVTGDPGHDVIPATAVPFESLVAYDRVRFSADRRSFLRAWIDQPGGSALVGVDHGRLAGFGVLRPCVKGYKVGPLFADNETWGERILRSLAKHAGGQPLFLDIPEVNSAAVTLAERLGMRPVFETARMYLGDPPDVPLDEVFGITTFELG